MKLSIVIVSYNTKDILLQCLKSIQSSGYNDSYEVIVVDNNSTDGSLPAIKQLNNLIIISNSSNLGFSKAVNQGIKKAAGKFILLLNSDIIVKPKAIESLISYTENHPSVGLVGGRLLDPNNQPQPSAYHFPTAQRALQQFWFHKPHSYGKYLPDSQQPTIVDAVVGAVMLIPSKTLEKVGLIDEKYFMYFEDLDYCKHVYQKGLQVIYYPFAEFIHYHGASGKTQPKAVNQFLIKSSKIYFGLVKHYLINTIIWSGQKWQKLTHL